MNIEFKNVAPRQVLAFFVGIGALVRIVTFDAKQSSAAELILIVLCVTILAVLLHTKPLASAVRLILAAKKASRRSR